MQDAHLAADSERAKSIVKVVILNNEDGASGAGHNGVFLVNKAGQGFFFSFYPTDSSFPGVLRVDGEMRTKTLTPGDATKFLKNGTVDNVTASGGINRGTETYNRFLSNWCTTQNGEAMYDKGMEIYDSPETYYLVGYSCNTVAGEILAEGNISFAGNLYLENSAVNSAIPNVAFSEKKHQLFSSWVYSEVNK